MSAGRQVALPLIAAGMIVLGLVLLDWANLGSGPLGGSVRLTPTGNELCAGGRCAALATGHGTWTMLARSVLVAGILTALAMVVVAVFRQLAIELGPVDRAVTWLCVAVIASGGMAMIATGASVGELGPGGPVTVLGGVLGLVGRIGGGDPSFGSGRSARPIRSTAGVGGAGDAPYRAPPASPAARPPSTRDVSRSLAEPERDRRPTSPAPVGGGKIARFAPAAPVGADATRAAVRFVVTDGVATAAGLELRFDRGGPRTVAWADIVEVVARRMPPDPPYDKTAFVDLVLAEGGPARLLPTTRLDLSALLGPAAPGAKENWRRLVGLARAQNPAIAIEPASDDFFAGGRDPVMFAAPKLFVAWDRRYG